MGDFIAVNPMTEDEETMARTIAEASVLPLQDAAYLLWRECSTLDLLARRAMPPNVRELFRSRPARENSQVTASRLQSQAPQHQRPRPRLGL